MNQQQIKIPATFMRGGTSKGVFFRWEDLPLACQQAGKARDALFMRVIGSPDPYSNQIDGMGGATSSTSKCVIISKSQQTDHDVDYLYGQVSIDKALVDWSGNCGNLSTAAGAFAIHAGYVAADRIPENGHCTVRIWQANIQKTILAHVPIVNGQVQELGDFMLDGVAHPAAEIGLEFMQPVDGASSIFPTGKVHEVLSVPEVGELNATLINAGIATVFVNAQELGLTGCELREDINSRPELLAKLEHIRVAAALKMGLIQHADEAKTRQHTPKIAFVAPAQKYRCASGEMVEQESIDVLVRALSMGKLHHAMMATCAVAISVAAAIPDTVVNMAAGGGKRDSVCFGHPSGSLSVGAEVTQQGGQWQVNKAVMSRSARIIFSGWVHVPAHCIEE